MRLPHIDLYQRQDHFARYAHVPSHLVHGTESAVPQPVLTIAIPTYRRPDLLREAVESALNQQPSGISHEIIVVDNEPADAGVTETQRIIRHYGDERLRYFRNGENIGMFANMNRCFELARGKWVAFLHDDDLLYDDYLIKLSRVLERKPGTALIASNYVYMEREKPLPPAPKRNPVNQFLVDYGQDKLMSLSVRDVYLFYMLYYGAPTCGAVFDREVAVREGGFNEDHFPSADGLFMFRINRRHKVYRPVCYFGQYQWAVNESLNLKTIKSFVEYLDLVRRFSINQSFAARVMDWLFRYEKHADSMVWCLNLDKSGTLKPEDFNYLCEYRIRPFRLAFYRFLQRNYTRFKIFMALIFG